MRKNSGIGASNQLFQLFAHEQHAFQCQDLPRLQAGAFDVKLRHDRFRVFNSRKAEPSLRIQEGDAFAGQFQSGEDFRRRCGRAQAQHPEPPRRGLNVSGSQFDQRFEFQCFKSPCIHREQILPRGLLKARSQKTSGDVTLLRSQISGHKKASPRKRVTSPFVLKCPTLTVTGYSIRPGRRRCYPVTSDF